ncbi:MAG TPA: NapC/NirT family cytochrome c [Candidatus Saccharimonadales bacterium]|nr:NapC/NirT family cytochrome c [Candidatus Saccharimonadales bacterium]
MLPLLPVLVGLIGLIIIALIYLSARPEVTRVPGGKALAFLLVFLAPGLALFGGATAHLERSKTTQFCLSCHIMEPYGKSLAIDDKEYIAAQHFQNGRVPRDHACYTCHTDYAIFGGVRSKMRGLRHVMVNYFGTHPDTIKLYNAYNNRECLHCHLGSRSFEQSSGHQDEATPMAAIKSGKVSCLEAGCHDVAHNVHDMADVTFYKPALEEIGP